jgi:hypothetical protein
MAILIKETEEKQIKLSGTDITIPEIYGRVEFVGRANGTTLEIGIVTYVSKQTFEENKVVFTDIESRSLMVNLEPNETQSLDIAHKYAKIAYEQQGYEVVIDLSL